MDSKLLFLLILPFVLSEPINLEELKELVDENAAEMQRLENEVESQEETIDKQKEIIEDQEHRIEQLEAKSSMDRMVPTFFFFFSFFFMYFLFFSLFFSLFFIFP